MLYREPWEIAVRQAASTRSRSSGWIALSHPIPRISSSDCPVNRAHSGTSTTIPFFSTAHVTTAVCLKNVNSQLGSICFKGVLLSALEDGTSPLYHIQASRKKIHFWSKNFHDMSFLVPLKGKVMSHKAPVVSPLSKFVDCEHEQIQHLGHIQSFGALIEVSADWMAVRCSENFFSFLQIDPHELIGHDVHKVLPPRWFTTSKAACISCIGGFSEPRLCMARG